MTGQPALLPPAAVFDWDNTLIDTLPLISDAFNAVRGHFGLPAWSIADVHVATQYAGPVTFKKHYGDRWQEAEKIFYDFIGAHHLSRLSTMGGASALLSGMHAMGVPMAVVSNKRGALLRAEVAHLGWGHFFHAVFGPDDAGSAGKPDPAGVLSALAAMPLAPEQRAQGWYVGDTVNDLRTARAANLLPVYIGHASGEIIEQKPAFSFLNCTDCLDYLNNLVNSRSHN